MNTKTSRTEVQMYDDQTGVESFNARADDCYGGGVCVHNAHNVHEVLSEDEILELRNFLTAQLKRLRDMRRAR